MNYKATISIKEIGDKSTRRAVFLDNPELLISIIKSKINFFTVIKTDDVIFGLEILRFIYLFVTSSLYIDTI